MPLDRQDGIVPPEADPSRIVHESRGPQETIRHGITKYAHEKHAKHELAEHEITKHVHEMCSRITCTVRGWGRVYEEKNDRHVTAGRLVTCCCRLQNKVIPLMAEMG